MPPNPLDEVIEGNVFVEGSNAVVVFNVLIDMQAVSEKTTRRHFGIFDRR